MQPTKTSGLPTGNDGKNIIGTTNPVNKNAQGIIMKTTENTCDSSDGLSAQKLPKLVEPYQILSSAESKLANLIDDSVLHLHGLMKGLHANQPADVKSYEPARIQSACACASEIHKLLRLKFDVLKQARAE